MMRKTIEFFENKDLRRMIKRLVVNHARFDKVWSERVSPLQEAYKMREEPAAGHDDPVADVA